MEFTHDTVLMRLWDTREIPVPHGPYPCTSFLRIQQLYEFETISRRRAAGAARLRFASVHFHVFSLFFRSLSAATGRGVAWRAICISSSSPEHSRMLSRTARQTPLATPGLARSAGFGRFADHKPQRSHLKGLSHSFPSMDSPDSVAMTNVEQLK